MRNSTERLNIHFALIKCCLVKVHPNILDISYCVDFEDKALIIQLVLLEGFSPSQSWTDDTRRCLKEFQVEFKEVYLTEEQFNENIGEWGPKHYKWLDHLLLSKAEI